MTRRPNPERKDELLEAVIDYLLEHGLSDLSLRPLAEALETSPRNLLYHFGSKEQLVVLALTEARRRQQQSMAAYLGEQRNAPLEDTLERFWLLLSSEENRAFLRLFFEVYGVALRDPEQLPGFPEAAVADWFPLLEQVFLAHGLPLGQAQAHATLVVAAVRGLLLDLLTIGDRQRVDHAYQELVTTLARPAPQKERRLWLRR